MVFFNDPVTVADHELEAVRFALAAQEQLASSARLGGGEAWRSSSASGSKPGTRLSGAHRLRGPLRLRGARPSYAHGSALRAASRQILVGPRVFGSVEESVEAEPVGELELKGFGRPVSAFSVRGLR